MDRAGRTFLHYAAMRNDLAQVAALLRGGADPDATDRQGFTPLHLACQEWATSAVGELLAAGASVDSVNGYGNTPLFVAVANSRGRGELIHLLRQHGADALLANNSGQTPLGLARLIANFDVAQYFVDLPT